MIALPGSSEAYFELVVSMNEVFAGINGSFSAVVDIDVRETYFEYVFGTYIYVLKFPKSIHQLHRFLHRGLRVENVKEGHVSDDSARQRLTTRRCPCFESATMVNLDLKDLAAALMFQATGY